MLGKVLLSLLCLSGWTIPSCLTRQYHYVDEPMTWTEAQTYCREKYTDLATIENTEDMENILSAVSSSQSDAIWIGLYSNIEWKWSDGYNGSGADYRGWNNGHEPNFYQGDQFCVGTGENGLWWDDSCDEKYLFFCYTGTQQDPEFVLVNEKLNWTSAQKHCRENFTDLAFIKNSTQNEQTRIMIPSNEWAWIGLHRDPNIYWSDGSVYTFENWQNGVSSLGSMKVVCGTLALLWSGVWSLVPCDDRNPFVCHSTHTALQVKLRMKLEDSSVDLNDPAVRAEILRKLQDHVNENGLSGVTLEWRQQPDGKVFHRDKKKLSADEQSKD